MEALPKLRLLAASVIFLQALDLASTALGLAAGHLERNPLVHAFGWTPLVLLKFACVLGLAALPLVVVAMPTEKREPFLKPTNRALSVLVAFYVVVVASNVAVAA